MNEVKEFELDRSRVYNPDVKERFLNDAYDNERTKNTIAYVFYASKEEEEHLNKDLYAFNREEIKKVMHSINPMTKSSSASKGRYISSYIDWATRNGYQETEGNISPFTGLQVEWYDQFVDNSRKLYYSIDEIEYMEKNLVNAQDQAVLRCIFEGISGSSLSELSNLHYYDIGWNDNVVKLKDEKLGEREVVVTDRCLRLIKSAYTETEYLKSNGVTNAFNPKMDLIPSDYIFKNAHTGRTKNVHGVDKHSFYRKLTVISEFFNYPYLTAKNVERSGMIYYAYALLKEGKYEEINNELLTEIGDRFGIKKTKINGEMNYNFYLMREYINPEIITSLYDDIEL